MSIATPEVETEVETGDQHLVLYGVDWDQYVTVNDAFPERRGLRMIYIDGSLTILTLSRLHDWFVDHVDSIIKAVALGSGIDLDVAGSATLRLETEKAGVEGDRIYYFGANALTMGGPINVDLTTQPPPDLAVEVVVTHPAGKAIAAYARIGVPEVWRLDARRGTVEFLTLGPDGAYKPVTQSRNLPLFKPEDLLSLLKIAEESTPFSRWSRVLDEWVRTTILPRMVEG
jgi:Uma2 family endonuclease